MTAREVINGYEDPLLYEINQVPIYKGGNQTSEYIQSLLRTPQAHNNVKISMFSGIEDEYLQTRKIARYEDKDYISVRKRDYATIYELKRDHYKPWSQNVYVIFLLMILFSLTEQTVINSIQAFKMMRS